MKKSAFSHPAASAALVWGGSVVGRKWALGSFSAVDISVLRGTGTLAILLPLLVLFVLRQSEQLAAQRASLEEAAQMTEQKAR